MIDPPAASSFSLLTGNLRFVWRPPFRQLARWLFVEHHIKEKLQEVEDNDGAKPAVWRPPFRQLARWLFVEHHIKEKLQEVEDNDGAKPADHPGGVGSGAQTAAATGANHHEV